MWRLAISVWISVSLIPIWPIITSYRVLFCPSSGEKFNPEVVFFVGDYAGADEYFESSIREHLSRCHYLAFSGPIELHYDDRALPLLDSHGSAIALLEHFFCDPAVYEDEASKEEEL